MNRKIKKKINSMKLIELRLKVVNNLIQSRNKNLKRMK